MKRPTRRAEIEAMHDRVSGLLSHAHGNYYHTLYGVYRTLQWVLGIDAHTDRAKFEEFVEAREPWSRESGS